MITIGIVITIMRPVLSTGSESVEPEFKVDVGGSDGAGVGSTVGVYVVWSIVGMELGLVVGSIVGLELGLVVGSIVGILVGIEEGSPPEGILVGLELGLELGLVVGSIVGLELGLVVWSIVGIPVGFDEGSPPEGILVGIEEGSFTSRTIIRFLVVWCISKLSNPKSLSPNITPPIVLKL